MNVSVKPCDDQEATSGCLVATFNNPADQPPAESPLAITCRGYAKKRKNAPKWQAFLLTPADATVMCTPPNQCFLNVPGLKPSTEYYAYCAIWHQPGSAEVFPEVPGVSLHTARWSPSPETFYEVQTLICIILVLTYVAGKVLFMACRRRWNFGVHEVGLSVTVGILIGYIINFGFGKALPFNYKFFSAVLLPLVIFAEGFTMNKSSFFNHSRWVILYGLFGTLIMFCGLYASIRVLISQSELDISDAQVMVLAASLASSDVVLPIAVLTPSPVYHIAVGEAIVNDIVCILLVSSIDLAPEAHKVKKHDDAFSILTMAQNLVILLLQSGVIGIIFGLIISYASKYFSHKRTHDVINSLMILMGNYAVYVVADLCKVSKYVLTCAVSVLQAYALYSVPRLYVHTTLSTQLVQIREYWYEGRRSYRHFRHKLSFLVISA